MLYPQQNETRQFLDLSGIWKFFLPPSPDRESFQWAEAGLPPNAPEIAVPSSFNDLFTDAATRDHCGAVWYETSFYLPPGWDKLWVGLRFDSVTHHADVWLNGQPVLTHRGGFLPFGGGVAHALRNDGPNRLTVRVDNSLDFSTLPMGEPGTGKDAGGEDVPKQITHFDFFNYAGIDRPVRLVAHHPVHLQRLRLTPLHRGSQWLFHHRAEISGDARITIRYLDPQGACVAENCGPEGETVIPVPKLWAPGKPYLYTAEVRVSDAEGTLLDVYREPCGLRSIEVTANRFLINGGPFYFRGFGKHEDFHVFGRGLNLPLLVRDFNLLEWIGANSVRTTHYPYSEEFLRMADRRGIAVIGECAAVGQNRFKGAEPIFTPDQIGTAALEHHKAVMAELIERDYNRPCVVMWSIANEPASGDPGAEDYFREVATRTRACDPTRPLTLVETTWWDKTRASQFVDVISLNRYFGWYLDPGNLEDITRQMQEDIRNWRARFGKPVMVTEYGADTITGARSLPPQMFTEDFQAEFLERYHAAFDASEGFIGEHVWNFADFMTKQGITRVLGNRKGVFTRERQPKAVAYLLRERWKHASRNASGAHGESFAGTTT